LFVRFAQSGDFSDVTFKVGGESFRAHKPILAARSAVFRAMFKAGGVEAITGEVAVEDVGPVAFKQVLRFIYADECEEGAVEA
jgi:speckle-type POZ protein